MNLSKALKKYISYFAMFLILFFYTTPALAADYYEEIPSSNTDISGYDEYEDDDYNIYDDDSSDINYSESSDDISSNDSMQIDDDYTDEDDLYTQEDISSYQSMPSSTPMLPKSGEVNSQEMNPNDWDFVISSGKSGDSFDFIKNGDSSSRNDKWMLYKGISMIVVALLGFLYLIISYLNKRKHNKKSKAKSNSKPNSNPSRGSRFQKINKDYDNRPTSSNPRHIKRS